MTRSRALTAVAVALFMTTISPMALAQDQCIGFEGNFWSGNCLVDPGKQYAKAYAMQNMIWKGKPHLAIDMGDEIQFFDLSNQNSPVSTGWTTFLMPLSGDAEHIMYQFSVGDDVRYAFSVHRAGVGIADLGNNGSPVPGMEQKWLRDYANPGADELNYDDNNIGGLVFDWNGRDFLLTHVFDDSCNGAATLYEMTGSITLTSRGCVTLPTGALGIQGGRKAGNFLYVVMNKSITNPDPNNVAIYEIQDLGGNPNLVQRAENLFRGDVLRKSSFDIDDAAGLIASADTTDNTVTIWSAGFGGLGGSFAAPTALATIDVPPDRTVWPNINGPRSLALAWPLLWVDGGGLYDVKTPNAPEILIPVAEYFHQSVDGPQNPVSTFNCLDRNTIGGAFHPAGTSLYLPRFPIAQVYDTSACTGPVQPLAALTVAPAPAFPGDPVTVTEIAAGTVEQRAIWITEGSNPDSTPVAGSQALSDVTPDTLDWTVPAGVTLAQEYWAHVAVGNVDYPYVSATGTPQQYATEQITLDRTPEAQITLSPSAPITGDTVTVQVTAEGAPGTDTGAPPFELTVTDPSGAPTTQTWNVGQSPAPIAMSTSGTWSFAAEVDYRHEAEGGVGGPNDPDSDGDHEAVDAFQITISSVAADFTITGTGSPPLHNEAITLTSTSNAAAGAVLTYAWVVDDLSGLPQYTCSTNPCVIAAETLSPGTYDFELTVTNTATDPDDVSVKVIRQEIADGSVNLDMVSPQAFSNPEIGDLVTFSITGVPNANDVTQVAWNFGGPSCDSGTYPQSWTCIPSGAITPELCLNGAYKYSTGGTKNVQATVTIAGVQWPVNTSINIASTGSCTVAPTCTYSIRPTSVSLDATGATNEGFEVVASSSSCSWTASTGYSWISLNTTNGTGTRYVYFDVAQNTTGSARTGTITAAGRTFNVSQSATGLCDITVSPSGGINLGPAAGSSGQFQVSAPAGCDWAARSLEGWLSVAPASGTGNGTVTVTATANTFPNDRTGEVEIDGTEYTVTQYPVLPADYEASNLAPDIGEWVTFTTDPRLEIQSWNFYADAPNGNTSLGSRFNCRGEGPIVNCDVVGQEACRTIQWNWPDRGPRYVTLRLKNGDTRTQRISVQDEGECPCEIEPPATSFTISSNPVNAREEVVFTDTTPGAPTAKVGATMTADPTNPIIGETVGFYLDARSADRVEWNFGATGCGGAPATATTEGPFSYATEFRYATAGTYTARATAYAGTTQIATGQVQVTVQNTGTCDGGGGGGGGGSCSYSLSPSFLTFDETGGNGQFSVTTQTGCSWTATESLAWVRFTGGSEVGAGSGTVTYAVDPNTGAERSGTITVQGKNHAITQLAATVGPEPGPPETWDWRITQGTDVIAEATGREFVWEPKAEGSYTVALTTSNCGGSTTVTQTLEVMPPLIPPVTKLVVPSAVRAPGLNNTTWKTDLRLFNPCDGPVDVSVKFQPEGQNNAGAFLPGFEASLGSLGSRAYSDVIQAIPSLANTEAKGSLLIEWDAPEDCRPLAMSKTYNETAFGTFGQFVPALAARAPLNEELILTGLIEDDGHRTNLGFANFGEEDVVLAITLYGQGGNSIGNPIYPTVPALSTIQVVRVANAAGLPVASDFSVKVETFGHQVKGYASVIDNDTGDPVYVLPLEEQKAHVVLPGLAHLTGLNDSVWRSDVALYNAHTQSVDCRIDYYSDEDLGQHYFLEFQGMPPGAEYVSEDFLGFLLGDRESKGYLTLACDDGAPAPVVAARTYNRAPNGGTYGQNLVAFGELDLIAAGERAYIPGIVGSADPDSGFRTNLGIVNTSETEWLGVNMWLYDASGNEIAKVLDWAILPPGGFYQENLFEPLGDVEGSLHVEVFAGGPALIYASQVDNVTQDPIFMPAIPASTLEN